MHLVRLPSDNPNDDSATLLEWLKATGDYVRSGEVICTVETSKAVWDVEADATGYLVPVATTQQQVSVGEVLAILAEQPVAAEELPGIIAQLQSPQEPLPAERAWTRKAELLARRHDVPLEAIRKDGPITEADVENYLKVQGPSLLSSAGQRQHSADVGDLVDDVYPTGRVERLLILGGGLGAVQVVNALRGGSQLPVGILDDNPKLLGKTVTGCTVLGSLRDLATISQRVQFDAVIISISADIVVRARLYEEATELGIPFANVIDPDALIHFNVRMGSGNLIMARCRIGPSAIIGDNNFLSAYVGIEHHNVVGSHCTFGPGIVTSSRVTVGNRVKFGTGIFVEPGITIGDDCIVASGAIITQDIPANCTVKVRSTVVIRPKENT